ncbi:MAG TPA: hypothetical protein ENK89_06635, partial [Desulfobulbaceae bacterium]|nr:hypothetical protein [Desulfobulbaceae bacterium]
MRYAIYFTPNPETLLWQKLCSWLGWNPLSGMTCTHPSFPEITPDRFHEITRKPRKYGPHATLKAPFHLRQNTSV